MIKGILKKYWGYDEFRPMQQEIISSALAGKDTLALMPTGGGKSVCFQVPAMAKEGICLVVSPLIALMKDQVQNLGSKGIKALAVYSGMTYSQIDAALDNAIYGDYKFLYVSPERLHTGIFRERVKKMDINFLVVDEAHCISQWGYDFRPAYLEISKIKELINDVPVIALTATATKSVAEDIMRILNFSEPNVISSGFERKNLSYVVRNVDDKFGNMLKICNGVPGTGIVYVRERKRCEEISSFLRQNGITADFYHAGLSKELRNAKQDSWVKGQTRVIVATNAFGMGIDKPDVRFVIHYDMPDSLEAYFQEAGRGGRDGKRSYATMLWNSTDISRLRQIHTISFPDIQYIKEIYQKVFIYLNIPYEEGKESVNKFNLVEFSKKYSLNSVSAYYAIKYLEQEGYWELTDELDNPSRIMFAVGRDELYKVQIDNPALDSFIKSILRIYTALFSRLTPIDEEYIARVTMDSPAGVKEKLKQLSGLRIIKYIPKVRTPLIIMNYERLVESNLYISQKRYRERKDLYQKRIESIISYVKEDSVCRSRMLIDYFGQEVKDDCGICDVCIRNRNNSNFSSRQLAVRKHILELLGKNGRMKIGQIETIAADEYKFYLQVLREMIDNGEVSANGEYIERK
ncbi:MAG: RecQ family ATP-dependent DNA helicase [Bacteroidales bacterium]|nr:RecQ family ATP-dependent DNA helicase [Bacteroidales bacterium]